MVPVSGHGEEWRTVWNRANCPLCSSLRRDRTTGWRVIGSRRAGVTRRGPHDMLGGPHQEETAPSSSNPRHAAAGSSAATSRNAGGAGIAARARRPLGRTPANLRAVRERRSISARPPHGGAPGRPGNAAARRAWRRRRIHEAAVPRRALRGRSRPVHRANATATLTMLVAARDSGVRRFIYAGSSSVSAMRASFRRREEHGAAAPRLRRGPSSSGEHLPRSSTASTASRRSPPLLQRLRAAAERASPLPAE